MGKGDGFEKGDLVKIRYQVRDVFWLCVVWSGVWWWWCQHQYHWVGTFWW